MGVHGGGCPEEMGVPKAWVSRRDGCPKAMGVPRRWVSRGDGCPGAMGVPNDHQHDGCPQSWVNGCPQSWARWVSPKLGQSWAMGVPKAGPDGCPQSWARWVSPKLGRLEPHFETLTLTPAWVADTLPARLLRAWVAKLVDAPDSKSGRGDPVRVRVSPQAPTSDPLRHAGLPHWLDRRGARQRYRGSCCRRGQPFEQGV